MPEPTIHPYLPKLKTGTEKRFRLPGESGVWEPRSARQLEQLADAIEIPPSQQRIYSIPDPWARVILFDRALADTDHQLHEQILGEWRGLLALIGLKDRRRLDDLLVRAVDFEQMARAGNFAHILQQLMPTGADLISDQTGWDRFYIFRWKGTPYPQAFACTSPMTLVATGTHYAQVLPRSIPWFDGTLLTDPTEHLSPRERTALAEWIRYLITAMAGFATGTARRGLMDRLLRDFWMTLDSGAKLADNPVNTILAPTSSALGLTHGIYSILNLPRKAEHEVLSDVAIVSGREPADLYFLIEPTLEQQWRQRAREIAIYRDVSLATPELLTRAGGNKGQLAPGTYWCTPDLFFSDRLIYEAEGAEAFPGCLPVKWSGASKKGSVVLPLTEEALRLFTPQQLQENFSVAWQPGGGALCQLQLMLRDSKGQIRPCTIQKLYADTDMIRIENNPLICMWPNFRVQDGSWKTYYLFQMWLGSSKEELSVEPWPPAGKDEPVARKHNMDNRRFQVYRTSSMPEALVCKTPYYNAARQREWSATGLLLLKQPDPISPMSGESALLGIDFGSTGSNAYYKRGDGQPTWLPLKSRLMPITDVDQNIFKDQCREYFLPTKDWPNEEIYLSVFHDFGDLGTSERIVLRDGHILFPEDPAKFIAGDRNRVMSNLKWGGMRQRIVAKDYLMQLCLHAAAELAELGVRDVDVRFSYPTAFSVDDLEKFRGNWNQVVESLCPRTGIKFTLKQTDPDLGVDVREAISATRFFVASGDSRMNIRFGSLIIDIGGGTTDLAIWKGRALQAQSSIVFAGRDILLAALRRRPQVLADIDPRIPVDRLQKTGGSNDSAFNAQLDAIVSGFGPALIKALPVKEALPSVKGLLGILETGLCGVGFYSGMLVRRLIEQKRYIPDQRIQIFVAGNGSKMFQWCALGYYSASSQIRTKFAKAFLAGANLDKLAVEVHLSERPKHEVAYGLVVEVAMNKDNDDFASRMEGEVFLTGPDQTRNEWSESVRAEDIAAMDVVPDRDFPMFSQFLKSIDNRFSDSLKGELGTYVDERLSALGSDVKNLQDQYTNADTHGLLRNEPIFIMALKRLLEVRIEEWARRA